MTLRAHIALLAIFLPLCACNGIFGDIYDHVDDDSSSQDAPFAVDMADPSRLTLSLNATSFTDWYFIDLNSLTVTEVPIPLTLQDEWDGRSGITYNEVIGPHITPLSLVPTSPQPEPLQWHFAIHHFDVRTAGATVALVPGASSVDDPIDTAALDFKPDVWTTSQIIVDLTGMMSYRIGYQNSWVNPVITDWVKMDLSSPPPVFSATGGLYVMRFPDGSCAALHMRSYIGPTGIKGQLTIDIRYPL